MDTANLLADVVHRIVQACHPECVVVFGSRAREDHREDSDLDLLVVEREPFTRERSRFQEMVLLERAMGNLPVATDILVYSQEEVDQWRHARNHVVARALREGKVVYEREGGSATVAVHGAQRPENHANHDAARA